MTDFNALRLKANGNAERLDEILQAECRHKYGRKFPHTLTCEGFRFPSLLAAEQATADLLAQWHASLLPPSVTVLDMTAGLGIDALHAARRAGHVTAIERDEAKALALRHNAAALGIENLEVVCADSIVWLEQHAGNFDVIFVDPARRDTSGRRVFGLQQCEPDIIQLLPLLRRRCNRLIIKASPMLDVTKTLTDLGGDADITVLGTPTECKEVVAVMPGTGKVSAVTVMADGTQSCLSDIAGATAAAYAAPRPGQWLYEPYPAVMKLHPDGLLHELYGVTPIAPSTHLFLSDAPVPDFPGRGLRISTVEPFDKRTIRQWHGQRAEVAVRNFPLTADALRKRLGITDGPALRIIGLTTANNTRLLVSLAISS